MKSLGEFVFIGVVTLLMTQTMIIFNYTEGVARLIIDILLFVMWISMCHPFQYWFRGRFRDEYADGGGKDGME